MDKRMDMIARYISILAILAIIILAHFIVLPLGSLDAKAHASQTYTVTMYSGGEVVREWHGVSDYTRFGYIGFRLEVDGTYIDVVGDVVIEVEP